LHLPHYVIQVINITGDIAWVKTAKELLNFWRNCGQTAERNFSYSLISVHEWVRETLSVSSNCETSSVWGRVCVLHRPTPTTLSVCVEYEYNSNCETLFLWDLDGSGRLWLKPLAGRVTDMPSYATWPTGSFTDSSKPHHWRNTRARQWTPVLIFQDSNSN